MKIFRCLVGLSDGNVVKSDGIEFEGKLWLVSGWLHMPDTKHAMPERIVRFDDHPHQATPGQEFEYQNILLPISESALDVEAPIGIEHRDHPSGLYVEIHELERLHPARDWS